MSEVVVVERGHGRHRCKLPRWWERRKTGLGEGAIVRCRTCKQEFKLSTRDGTDWVPIPPYRNGEDG